MAGTLKSQHTKCKMTGRLAFDHGSHAAEARGEGKSGEGNGKAGLKGNDGAG
jgi:hypothetical protein